MQKSHVSSRCRNGNWIEGRLDTVCVKNGLISCGFITSCDSGSDVYVSRQTFIHSAVVPVRGQTLRFLVRSIMEKGVTKRYTKDIRLIQMPEDVVEVQTKWFSAQEGYGFLTTENHTDCRIRARVLEAANIQSYELNKKNKFFVRLSSSSGITKVAEIWRATL